MAPDWRDQRIAELEGQLREAQAAIAALKAHIVQLEQRIAELERASKRRGLPFARDEHKADPKKPGRKAGQGLFSYRAKPTLEEVGETKEEPLDGCLECGGSLTDVKEHEQFVVDIPEVQPKITQYVTHSGYCGHCNRRVRPAIVTRKTSGCNRTEGGAETHSILASILVTCRQHALPMVDFLVKVQRAVGGAMPGLLPAAQLDTS